MGTAIVAGVVALITIILNGIIAFFASRNDRALMGQEIELLKKIDPNTDTAKKIREVINARATRWHDRAYKHRRDGSEAKRNDWTSVAIRLTAIVSLTILVGLLIQGLAGHATEVKLGFGP